MSGKGRFAKNTHAKGKFQANKGGSNNASHTTKQQEVY